MLPRQILDGDRLPIQVDVRVSHRRSDVAMAGPFPGVDNAGAVGQQPRDVGVSPGRMEVCDN